MWLIIVLIIIAVIVVIAMKVAHEIKIAKAEEQKREKEKKRKEQARKIYWNSLHDIYKGVSNYELQQLINLYEAAMFYSERIEKNSVHYSSKEMRGEWADRIREIQRILGNRRWKYGPTDAYTSDSPLYYDLDIRYINNLLKK